MKHKFQRLIAGLLGFIMLLQIQIVHAENLTGAVVINEIAWMGTLESSTAEWIELYNPTDFDVDISGWTIIDDDTTEYLIESGNVPAKGYFLVASNETALPGITPDAVISLSLANSGDSLVLNDEFANQIDEVNLSGGAWYAGDNTAKLTMERLDPNNIVDSADNWANSKVVEGTPKAQNQVEPDPTPNIELILPEADISTGDTITVTASITDAKELFAYGVDITYDPTFLEYVSSTEGTMLSQNTYTTSFQSGLENGVAGKLVVGGAIIEEAKPGVNGEGQLFTVDFKVLGETEPEITFADTSFISKKDKEIAAIFAGTGITVANTSGGGGTQTGTITNLTASLGSNQYEFNFNWETNADKSKVFVKNQLGEFMERTETSEKTFTETENIIPEVEYEYKIVPYVGETAGEEQIVKITETRGIKGDSDRSNRVDGRDLKALAASFSAEMNIDNEYEVLIDTTYDGLIDGNDLIDIGANWASVYTN